MKRLLLSFVVACLMASPIESKEARLLRFPDIHLDKVTFVYAGDIYVAQRSGGQAVQLTTHEGLELFPKFSPDGSQIAFDGQYDGDMSVYVMPTTGGEPTRLTYHPGIQPTSERMGPENIVMDWHPDGDKVLFRSRKELPDVWSGRAYLVDVKGGLPQPLPMTEAGFTSFSPDAKKVAYCPIFRDFRTWKRYKGGMAQDVWIFDLVDSSATKITDWVGTDNIPMWYEDRIYFNSDRTGKLNLYCYEIATKETRQVTEFTEWDVRWPSLGPDGIIFENGGYLYVLDLPSEKAKKLEITLATDRHKVRAEVVDLAEDVDDWDIAPNGKRAVFRARGEIFSVPATDGDTRNLSNGPKSNEMYPRWSPDGKWVAYLSDISGEEEYYLASHDGKETVQLTSDGDCHRYAPTWSPNSKMLTFADKNRKLYYIDIETKDITLIDRPERSRPRQISWSPDSKYLSYAKDIDNEITAIFVYSLLDKNLHQVTPGLSNDYSPVFSPCGKYLYFLSQRNFNPILSEYEFSFANAAIEDIYVVVLSNQEKSPFMPKCDEAVEAKTDDDGDPKSKDRDADKKADKEKAAVEVKIDFDGIYDRQVALDIPAGNYRGLAVTDDAVFYLSNPIYGLRGRVAGFSSGLHKYDIAKRKDREFMAGINSYRITPDGKKILTSKDNSYRIIGTGDKKADRVDVKLNLSHVEMRVDHQAEYAQMFDQVWRRYRDFFYDENMHGVDWTATRERYEALLPYVSHRFDLTYVLGEMVGDLCCSHTYIGGGEYPDILSSKVGLLGIEFEIDHYNTRICIKKILEGQNWDDDLRSPLTEPGVDVNEGDYLLAINGEEIFAGTNPYALTLNTVGKEIKLTVNDKPTVKGAREVTVKPIASESSLRYYNWVQKNQRYVDSLSGGQIGYLHIPDMGGYGLVQFAKMFYNQLRQPGLIIDVRYNGGGFVSQLIIERLRRITVGMSVARDYPGGRIPGAGLNAHMITLLNEYSCSDGDLFPYYFREYELGPLMGKRSWGGVVGISGHDRLVDGGYYTVPQYTFYDLNGNWVIENIGVVPDQKVDNLPDRSVRGFDDQLEEAVKYIKTKMTEEPKTLPPKPGPPAPR